MSVLVVTLLVWWNRASWEWDEGDVWQSSLVVLRRTGTILLERMKGLNPFYIRRVPQHDRVTLSDQLGEVRVV